MMELLLDASASPACSAAQLVAVYAGLVSKNAVTVLKLSHNAQKLLNLPKVSVSRQQ